ncbi:hypothetical protein A6R68_01452, partial [Neotoma lepida]
SSDDRVQPCVCHAAHCWCAPCTGTEKLPWNGAPYDKDSMQSREKRPEAAALGLYHRLPALGRTRGHTIQQQAASTTKAWWDRYKEFVGLNEVREAQGNVTEAEKVFMVARGLVREARENLEAQQAKLKEVRDHLDRVSREDNQYLELATLEQDAAGREEAPSSIYTCRRLRAGELCGRVMRRSAQGLKGLKTGPSLDRFSGFDRCGWLHRVGLQELKALLLEAQKGPVSLQEAIREQASSYSLQQRGLKDLMVDLRGLVHAGQGQGSGSPTGKDIDVLSAAMKEQLSHSQQVHSCLEGLREQLDGLEKTCTCKRPGLVQPVDGALPSSLLEQGSMILTLSDVEQRLEAQVNRNTICSTLVTCVTFMAALPVLYMLFKTS